MWLRVPTSILVVIVSAACRGPAGEERVRAEDPPAAVAAQPAETGSLRAVVQATGVVVPAEGAEFLVIAPEAARVIEVAKAEGDAVQSGEVVVRFELSNAAQEVSRLRADLARAQAQLENARVARTRTADFVARGLVPRRDQEIAERELAEAQTLVDRSTAAAAAAEAAAARAVIRAPFNGVVAKRLHNPGDLVQAAATDPVLRIVDPKRIEVHATVADADASRVVPGATARMRSLIDGASIPLTVMSRGAGTAVRLAIGNAAGITVDARVDIDIDAEERSGIVFVPAVALVNDGGAKIVMIAAGDRAERRPVTTGLATDDRVEITSGLQRGELVITRGHVGLVDGARITVAQE